MQELSCLLEPVGGSGGGFDFDEHNGDVVGPARVVRVLDELAATAVEVRFFEERLEHLLILQHAVQAIGAEQVEVPWTRVGGEQVDDDIGPHPKRARDVVRGQLLYLLLGEPRRDLAHLADERVIGGELRNAAVANAVTPAVTDMADDSLARVGREHQGDDGRPHPRLRRPAGRASAHGLVREADTDDDAIFLVAEVLVVGKRPRPVESDGRGAEVRQRRDREGAGDISRHVATHPVGDRHEPMPRKNKEGILVALADEANVTRCRITGSKLLFCRVRHRGPNQPRRARGR